MKKKLLTGALALVLLLTGCSLLPEEEVYTAAIERPRSENTATYEAAQAEVGDVVLTERISVKYASVRRESLAFSLNGCYYDQTFVTRGDSVEEGQIIMALDASGVQDKIDRAEALLAEYEMQLRQKNEEMAFYLERGTAKEELTGREFDAEAVRARYAADIRALEDQIYVCRAQLDQLQRQLETYYVRAPFSGTVTYLLSYTEFDLSEEGRRVAEVSDLSSCVFSAMVGCEDALNPDEIYLITSGSDSYEAHYVSAEELGMAPEVSGDKTRAYFQLVIPPLDLSENATGNVTVTLDVREGVIRVPNSAVITTEHGPAVYVLDENGLRSVRQVEIGLVGNDYTEIISGLEEGETVIL